VVTLFFEQIPIFSVGNRNAALRYFAVAGGDRTQPQVMGDLRHAVTQ
jgi:hypothetical protein